MVGALPTRGWEPTNVGNPGFPILSELLDIGVGILTTMVLF